MWWRLAFPLIFFFGPRLIPRLVRNVWLVWKLTFDRRVPLLLKLLIPGTVVVLPWFIRVPYVGLAAYLLVLSLAVFIFINVAPRYVVEGYAPWRARPRTEQDGKGRSSRVVEGSSHVVDEEKPSE